MIQPFGLITYLLYDNNPPEWLDKIPKMLDGGALMFVIMIYGLRFYLLFYEYKLTEAKHNFTWRLLINPESKNFYLRNRHKYGELNGLLKIALPIFVILYGIDIVLVWINIDVSSITQMYIFVVALAGLVLCVTMYCKFPIKQRDSLSMRRELKYTTRAFGVMILVTLIWQVIMRAGDFNIGFLGHLVVSMVYAVFLYYSIIWVIHDNNRSLKFHNLSSYQRRAIKSTVTWRVIAYNDKGYAIFIEFLGTEFRFVNVNVYIQFGYDILLSLLL